MSLLNIPKPPAPPENARKVTSVTAEDLEAAAHVPKPPPQGLRRLRKRQESEELHARLASALQANRTATAADLARLTGDHIVNVYAAMREMRRARRAHIARVGIPLVYAAGPSPAGEELDIAHLPGENGRSVLLLLLRCPHTSREIGKKLPACKHWQAIRDLFDRGFVMREGEACEFKYSLTESGRTLANYIAKLEEAYPCS